MTKEFIFSTDKGRVLITAENQAQAEQALRNSKKYTRAKFVGVQIASE